MQISKNEIKATGLILVVKIKNALALSKNDSRHFNFNNIDDSNLKSRTLGNWVLAKEKADRIKYIIGVNTGGENLVVSAYEVTQYERKKTENGRYRYRFQSSSNSEILLKELGIYQKKISDLNFGHGAEKTCFEI
ncbi:hypothetical protein AP460_02286 [Actinobacillus pleuropneumoniae]|uniref:Uncharacterized protein n=1 Tax=Actinobacillus pleuropneumoniae serotype 3 (strain JL03) TaxID=434271 RepID=B0BSX4_ACTPJ|nr:hypothetical protein [Actinobacillus pleuropneumoniae]ABY70388.1 hypothetical protein APJL_1838 [Actinobacillus pleuropneumoniae serovar 3 str. JL03]KIE88589.1 hypothetical protein AP518_02240 [Actinobacillus pleuropneumoniae]KIE88687.1 hypothetical protein AP460_02286 [Actinobacillus pleuropneumoniae]KIE88785.1 hypothetical protein AP1022_02139 [Actinobacillus pleuropneumoniae]KIE94379.1 hypothetical protein AP5651_02254 [Actinobacillus pleuropneumoniae]